VLLIYIILGHFAAFLEELCALKLSFILIFLIYAWIWLFDAFSRDLDHFNPAFDPYLSVF